MRPQLLSKIDGVNSLNNILLIGMTNRRDMIDDALLRPGRLEIHVEIGLPNMEGRVQILKIHTQTMRQNFVDGIAWGEAKKQLFELINEELREPRERYNELMENPEHIEKVLREGAEKARAYSVPFMEKLNKAVGLYSLA